MPDTLKKINNERVKHGYKKITDKATIGLYSFLDIK